MKKFFMMAVMAVAALTASAQNEAGSFTLTPYVGAGYGQVTNYKYNDEDGKVQDLAGGLSAVVGADVQYNCTESFGISLGLGYQYHNSDQHKVSVNGKTLSNHEIKAGFLNIPVLAHYQFGDHFSIKAGVQPAFLLHCKDGDTDLKDEDETNNFNLSIPVGIAWKFNSPLELGLQYNIPVTRLNKDEFKNADDYHFIAVMLTLGYRINL